MKSLEVYGPQLPLHKKIPKRMNDYFGNETAESHHHTSVKGLYQQPYFEVFDSTIESIKRRFDQEGFRKYFNIQQHLLKAIGQKNYQEELQKQPSRGVKKRCFENMDQTYRNFTLQLY